MPTPIRDQQRRDTWSALQAAALDLVDRRGYGAVTVDDIAAAAGVSRRTFFNHFATKAAALFDPHPDDAERMRQLLRSADTTNGCWAALREVCLSFAGGGELALPVRRRLVDEHPELAAYQRTAHAQIGAALDNWITAQLPEHTFAASLLREGTAAVMLTAFLSWRAGEDPARFRELMAAGFDMVTITTP